jgi:hypothetical protein
MVYIHALGATAAKQKSDQKINENLNNPRSLTGPARSQSYDFLIYSYNASVVVG